MMRMIIIMVIIITIIVIILVIIKIMIIRKKTNKLKYQIKYDKGNFSNFCKRQKIFIMKFQSLL